MKKSFTADDFFFPARDEGLFYLGAAPDPLIRRPSARVRQSPRSESLELNRKMRSRMEDRWRWPTNPPIFETLSRIMVAHDLNMGQRKIFIGDRLLLSAAAGDRVWKSVLNGLDSEEEAALNAEFLTERQRRFKPPPVTKAPDDKVPFVLDMRNGYNFYHFLTELMPQLAVVATQKSNAPIFIHLPVLDVLSRFPSAFIQAVYPEMSKRVVFTEDKTSYPRARIVYNHRHYAYQVGDPRIDDTLSSLAADDPWRAISSHRASRKFLLKSTYDTGMRLLRDHVLGRITAENANPARPARIWIGRDPKNSSTNHRPNLGEDVLLGQLAERGFQVVYLERMSPLEQMATVASAEAIVAPHGAAFAHMIFARRDATVIEMATPQTQLHRWGDFLGNAHVAQCRYCTVFADTIATDGSEGSEGVPAITDGLKGIAIGPAATSEVINLIDQFHPASPPAGQLAPSL